MSIRTHKKHASTSNASSVIEQDFDSFLRTLSASLPISRRQEFYQQLHWTTDDDNSSTFSSYGDDRGQSSTPDRSLEEDLEQTQMFLHEEEEALDPSEESDEELTAIDQVCLQQRFFFFVGLFFFGLFCFAFLSH